MLRTTIDAWWGNRGMGFRFNMGSSRSSGKPRSFVGKLGMSLFFLVFLGIGLFFFAAIGLTFWNAAAMFTWPAVDCQVTDSQLLHDPQEDQPYELQLTYTYRYESQEYQGHRYHRDGNRFDEAARAQRLRDALTPGTRTTCYVDPGDPDYAVLRRSSLWIGLAILLPLVFIAVGGGGIYFIWRGAGTDSAGSHAQPRSLTRLAKKKQRGVVFLVLFFMVFAIAGGAMFYFMLLRPVLLVFDAQDWPQTPCRIISSEVGSHDSDDGTTYSIDINFSYTYGGREYTADTYSFAAGGSSSGYAGKARVVDQYPAGSEATCYVNPDDPYQAVLNRGMTGGIWVGLFSLPFLLVGVGGLIGTGIWVHRQRAKAMPMQQSIAGAPGRSLAGASIRGSTLTPQTDATLRSVLPDFEITDQPIQLKPATARWAKLLGIIAFCVIWNGLVSVFVTIMVRGHMKGNPDWFMTLFMIPFVLIGLALVGAVFYQLLAMFNPRVMITVSSRAVALGQPLDVAWDIVGQAGRITRLQLELLGREEAQYQRGTNTVTDHSTFARLTLVDTDDPMQIVNGAGSVVVPPDTMHSLKLAHNKIEWKLKLRGHIARWPDVTADYDIVVLPVGAGEAS